MTNKNPRALSKNQKLSTPILPPIDLSSLFSFSDVNTSVDFQKNYIDVLPDDATVCSLSLDFSEQFLLVTRLRRGLDPLLLRIPFKQIPDFGVNVDGVLKLIYIYIYIYIYICVCGCIYVCVCVSIYIYIYIYTYI